MTTTTRDLNIRGEGAAIIRRIEAVLPDTFYAGLPVASRVEMLVDAWRRAIAALADDEGRRDEDDRGAMPPW